MTESHPSVRSVGCSHLEDRMNMSMPQALPRRGTRMNEDLGARMGLNFHLHAIITGRSGLFVIIMILNLIILLGQNFSSFILLWIRRLWEEILAKGSSSDKLQAERDWNLPLPSYPSKQLLPSSVRGQVYLWCRPYKDHHCELTVLWSSQSHPFQGH